MQTTKDFECLADAPVSQPCAACGEAFELPNAWLAARVKFCCACAEQRARAARDASARQWAEERAADWRHVCPAAFQATDPARLPRPEFLSRVLEWRYGARGLLLHGRTGLGKSHCAWSLAKREFMAGREVLALTCGVAEDFQAAVARFDAERWVRRHSRVKLLLLDDVFKARLTDALEHAIYTIIATRCDQELPMIVTTNDTGKTLKARLSVDRAEPLLRRLREHCEAVAFE